MQNIIQSCRFNLQHSALSIFLIKSFIPFVDTKKEPAQKNMYIFFIKNIGKC